MSVEELWSKFDRINLLTKWLGFKPTYTYSSSSSSSSNGSAASTATSTPCASSSTAAASPDATSTASAASSAGAIIDASGNTSGNASGGAGVVTATGSASSASVAHDGAPGNGYDRNGKQRAGGGCCNNTSGSVRSSSSGSRLAGGGADVTTPCRSEARPPRTILINVPTISNDANGVNSSDNRSHPQSAAGIGASGTGKDKKCAAVRRSTRSATRTATTSSATTTSPYFRKRWRGGGPGGMHSPGDKFPIREARERARSLQRCIRLKGYRLVVVLGGKVATAFGYKKEQSKLLQTGFPALPAEAEDSSEAGDTGLRQGGENENAVGKVRQEEVETTHRKRQKQQAREAAVHNYCGHANAAGGHGAGAVGVEAEDGRDRGDDEEGKRQQPPQQPQQRSSCEALPPIPTALVLPHPSGVSHYWNSDANIVAASTVFRQAICDATHIGPTTTY